MRWPRATPRRHRRSSSSSTCAAAIRAALDLAQPTLDRARLQLVVDVPEHLPARANPDPLAQVLGNLLSNAARYTPAGGTVTVRAERRPADLLVSIANTGEGIPPDDLDRVFERFYRVEKSRDRAHGGAGIGLAIVKQLVEAGGGRVGAESGDGHDALLVQPAGVGVRGWRCATIPVRIPASPSHWMGRSRSPRSATATRIVTAGPNDAARLTIQVGADSSPVAKAMSPRTSRMPAIVMATTTRLAGHDGPPAGRSIIRLPAMASTDDDRDPDRPRRQCRDRDRGRRDPRLAAAADRPSAGGWAGLVGGRVVVAIVLAGILDVLGLIAFATGLETAPTWMVGLAASFGPAVTILVAVAFLGERLRPIQWVGLAGILTGMVAIAIP